MSCSRTRSLEFIGLRHDLRHNSRRFRSFSRVDDSPCQRRRRNAHDRPGDAGILIGIVCVSGLLFGRGNEWLADRVSRRRNPFVATLGTMTVCRDSTYVATNCLPALRRPLLIYHAGPRTPLRHSQNPTILFLLVALFGLSSINTLWPLRLCRRRQFCRLSPMGVNAARVRFAVYVSRVRVRGYIGHHPRGQTASATPQAALGYELPAIAAVIVGGAALGGGRGR